MTQENTPIYCPSLLFSPIELRNWLKKRIADGEPTSVIRLGDGEFALLGYDRIVPWEHTSRALRRWFGHDNFDSELLFDTANKLRDAVRAATVIGIPRTSRQKREVYCQYVHAIFNQYELANPKHIYTDCGVHRFWQMLLAYHDFLQNLPFLGIVSSKDISKGVSQTFGIKQVTLYPISAQHSVGQGCFEHTGPHYPERFDQLCTELTVPYQGAVFLIGAGALGKIYADVIYKKGGIAIDIGSVMDGWAGVASRPFLVNEPEMFSLQCYSSVDAVQPKLVVERYHHLLRQATFGNPPVDEEILFLGRDLIYPDRV